MTNMINNLRVHSMDTLLWGEVDTKSISFLFLHIMTQIFLYIVLCKQFHQFLNI